ncbi:hypothetical protein HO133_001560 [Letharia lupina]|uniref:Uncharacterized protein n=1 Tax=Letharia lupina TaxID=560253 RepID=A0A8H6CDU8_9LECA|nr:uncharacterized protein HO133_001560 [Letharia lupina]KAF6221594.1 hypothetical protein HO133_001560 [Letharia lupina]
MHSFFRLPLLLHVISVVVGGVIPYLWTVDPTSLEPDRDLTEVIPSANNTALTQPSHANLSDHISFVDVIYDGVKLVRSRYSRAVFREAKAASIVGPATDPHYLTDMRLVFSRTQGDYRSVYLEMTETWPRWGEPRLTTNVPPGDYGVLPSRFGMDIVDADRRMKAAGFGQRYKAVDIRWPAWFPEEWQQALYFFQMDDDGLDFVTVGARDGRVIPFDHALDAAEIE